MEESLTFAHSHNAAGQRHPLLDHLQAVSTLAASFAKPFGGQYLAGQVGLLHDIGKVHPAWQHYLLAAETHLQHQGFGPDHKGAGAVVLAQMGVPDLALLIQGHHGGLTSSGNFRFWLQERMHDPLVQEALALAQDLLPELQGIPRPPMPDSIHTRLEAEFFLRMLFSALVDADALDTEAHFRKKTSSFRQARWDIAQLLKQFETFYQQQFARVPQTPVNIVRANIYHDCVRMAQLPPGFYRLTVPTGGGKTLASLAFGLTHAQAHGKARLIYAIPYMSITEQTAQVFRRIFATGVLEHHSGLAVREDLQTLSSHEIWQRLAAENWDAPLIVTTTVQLFESLLARAPSACRKLHNIAQSVIVLDEVQMLPTTLLTTILDVLRQLVAQYGVTVILCTATQPALHARDGFEGLSEIQEIVPYAQEYFAALRRVRYQVFPQKLTWAETAAELRKEHQVLAIVNTRADAHALVEALSLQMPDAPSLFHLSTRMCGAHRRAVLQQIRQRLAQGEPCHVVSTQLIEAGVDIDFPCVWRALGPLDRIAQAAGRANREGTYPIGYVIIFEPAEGTLPLGPYHIGTQISRSLLATGAERLHDPTIFQNYFEELFEYVDRDTFHIQAARRALDYEAVAERFRFITEQTIPVVVPYLESEEPGRVARYLGEVVQDPSHLARSLRLLQPYLVTISESQCKKAAQQGLIQEVYPGLWQWLGQYASVQGIVLREQASQDDSDLLP